MSLLSDASVRALEAPKSGQKLYTDPSLKGFGVRVSQGGTKTFVVVVGRDRRFLTLGRYGIITLAQARVEAKRKLAEHTLGKLAPKSISYHEGVDQFLADKANQRRPATVSDYKRRLSRLGFKGPISEITHDDATRKLSTLKAPSERSHTLVASKVFFNWCLKRRYRTDNPFFGLSKPKLIPRKRALSGDELKRVWTATEPLTLPDRITRLLLVTGQRMMTVEQWHPSFIEGNLLTVPETVTKNGHEQLLPLGPLALQLLDTFPTRFTSWGQYKAALDERTGINEPWMLRDLRRTFRTGLGRLGVPPHIAERLMHHITVADPVQLTYDRYTYVEEMSAAMLKWEQYLSENVVS